MEIKQFTWNYVNSNSWLIIENGNGVLVDAIDSNQLYSEISELNDLKVIITHSHFDHICGLNQVRKKRPDAKVISTHLCSEYMGNIYRNMSSSATAFMAFYNGSHNIEIEPFTCKPSDITFNDIFEFQWNKRLFKLISYQGHSLDGLIVLVDDAIMFSGDTLLSIPTVTRFPNGSTNSFWKDDIPRLMNLPAGIVVYPGHGDPGTLSEMIAINIPPSLNTKSGLDHQK